MLHTYIPIHSIQQYEVLFITCWNWKLKGQKRVLIIINHTLFHEVNKMADTSRCRGYNDKSTRIQL